MMPDVMPYTKEEASRLGKVLIDLGCPSFGPGTGAELLKVAEGVQQIVIKNKDRLTAEQKLLLSGFSQRILDVCAVGGSMQGAVLEHFSSLLKGGK